MSSRNRPTSIMASGLFPLDVFESGLEGGWHQGEARLLAEIAKKGAAPSNLFLQRAAEKARTFEIRKGEKGVGLFATKDLHPGQIILIRWPMAVVPVSESDEERSLFIQKFSPRQDTAAAAGGGEGGGVARPQKRPRLLPQEGGTGDEGDYVEDEEGGREEEEDEDREREQLETEDEEEGNEEEDEKDRDDDDEDEDDGEQEEDEEGDEGEDEEVDEDEEDEEEEDEEGEDEEEEDEEAFLERVDVARLCLSLVSKISRRRALFPELSDAPFFEVLPSLQLLQPREETHTNPHSPPELPGEWSSHSPSLDALLETQLERAGAKSAEERRRFLWVVALNAMGTYPDGPEQLSYAHRARSGEGGTGSPGGEGVGLFDLPSFFNHSCEPNVNRYFLSLRRELPDPVGTSAADGPREPLAVFVASRPVRGGDELCISYAESEALCEDRRSRAEALQEGARGFSCICPACAREARESEGKPFPPTSYEALPEEIREALSLPSPPEDRIDLIEKLLAEADAAGTGEQKPGSAKRARAGSLKPLRVLASADHLELLQTRAELRGSLVERLAKRERKEDEDETPARLWAPREDREGGEGFDRGKLHAVALQCLEDWKACIAFVEGGKRGARKGPGFPPNDECLVVFRIQAARAAAAAFTSTANLGSAWRKEAKGGKGGLLGQCREHLRIARCVHQAAFGGGSTWFSFRYREEVARSASSMGKEGRDAFKCAFTEVINLANSKLKSTRYMMDQKYRDDS
uniref:SET domain-containing protein n=1 Tax=Chromera velia CCMP2878 TaxID=1169474 RepID=A0A0G4FU30_9ALVE|eukprot:Cvel_18584.t1-p1 / transcript=Cvel_18584.t1 / gene=Cvel_18584 / organism=Chromera_velia_CCMP2878 / gene_product=hypothetical protein / transcript_product=hypothetical protein / location=Cvel_scaffold1550:21242-24953(+) / protein_length=749 / sequence_SO=supercontig / SO=protein_coding / is_pseudo=false